MKTNQSNKEGHFKNCADDRVGVQNMQITLFGMLWIYLLLCIWLVRKRNLASLITYFMASMIFQSNIFIRIGLTAVGIQIVSAGLLFGILLPNKGKSYKSYTENGNISTSMLLYFLLGFMAVLTCTSLMTGVIRENLIGIAMVILYGLLGMMLLSGRVCLTMRQLQKTEDVILILILVIGLLQVLTKAGIMPLRSVLKTFIYNDDDPNVIFNNKSTTAFYSTFMEPSYCGMALVGFFNLYSSRKKSKKNILLAIIICIAIILTRSTTAYIALMISFAVIYFTDSKDSVARYITPSIICILLLIFIFNNTLLNEVLMEKKSTASYRVRSNWNQYALDNFLNSPLIGVGYGEARASSLFFTVLAEMGLIGIVSYILIIFYFCKVIFSKAASDIVRSHAYMIVGISICQFIACPDLNNCVFWLGFYLFSLSCSSNLPDEGNTIHTETSVVKALYENR